MDLWLAGQFKVSEFPRRDQGYQLFLFRNGLFTFIDKVLQSGFYSDHKQPAFDQAFAV